MRSLWSRLRRHLAEPRSKDNGNRVCRYYGAPIRGARIHWWCRDLETKGK